MIRHSNDEPEFYGSIEIKYQRGVPCIWSKVAQEKPDEWKLADEHELDELIAEGNGAGR